MPLGGAHHDSILDPAAFPGLDAARSGRSRIQPGAGKPRRRANGSRTRASACSSTGASTACSGRGEWVMNNDKIPVSEYEKLAPQFNPTKFNAAEWVAMAKQAGMKYITITSKHHDGFAMLGTKQNKWNIVDATPYRQRPAEDAGRRMPPAGHQAVLLSFAARLAQSRLLSAGAHGPDRGTARRRRLEQVSRFHGRAAHASCSPTTGQIGGIWFDGMWDKPDADWRLAKTYGADPQPAAGGAGRQQSSPDAIRRRRFSDVRERSAGAERRPVSTRTPGYRDLPLETCDTINGAWGYNANDKRFKSTTQLIQYLVRAAGIQRELPAEYRARCRTERSSPSLSSGCKEMGGWLDKIRRMRSTAREAARWGRGPGA